MVPDSVFTISTIATLWLFGPALRQLPRKILRRAPISLSFFSLSKIAAACFVLGLTFFPTETGKIIGPQTATRLIPLFVAVGGLAAISAATRLVGNMMHVAFWGAITVALLAVPDKTDGRQTAAPRAAVAGYEVPEWVKTGGKSILDHLKKVAALQLPR